MRRRLRRNRRLRTWVVFFASLFAPGLGHVALGLTQLGLLFYGLFLVGLAVGLTTFMLVPVAPVNVVFAAAVWLPCYLGPALHASARVRQESGERGLESIPWIRVGVGLVAAFIIGQAYNFTVSLFAETITNHGGAMEPTLRVGDRVMVRKIAVHPQRGDIVAVHWPDTPASEIVFERVVGLPGETVEIRDQRAWVDGELADEWGQEAEEPPAGDLEPVQVPPDHFYLLGDQRLTSHDSRRLGPVPAEDVVGEAVRVGVSLDPHTGTIRWDRLGKPLP